MSILFINIMLAFAWSAMTGSFTFVNVVFGFAIGAVSLSLIREQLSSRVHYKRFYGAISLALTFLWELVKSSVIVARIVLSPRRELRPAIIAYPLDVTTAAEITLLANLITLTPGTLSIDVSEDSKTLYVHAIDAPDPEATIADIKSSFERRIERLFHT